MEKPEDWIDVEVHKFKKLINDMFLGFPNWIYDPKRVEETINNPYVLKDLLDKKFLIKESYKDKDGKNITAYSLGVDALPIVSAWRSEKLTEGIGKLTLYLLGYTIFLVILTILLIMKG